MNSLEVKSPSWLQGSPMPAVHTCDGANISPALEWTAGPQGTQGYALICDDPDAPLGTWTHWTIWNLPSNALDEHIPPKAEMDNGAVQGRNSWSRIGYGGPCPPSGMHHYHFRIFALDVRIDLAPGSDARRLRAAMEGHVLAEGTLVGTYEREKPADSGAARA